MMGLYLFIAFIFLIIILDHQYRKPNERIVKDSKVKCGIAIVLISIAWFPIAVGFGIWSLMETK